MLTEVLAALAATGGTAVVAAMATDAWSTAKVGFARLLGREDQHRVEVLEAQLDEDCSLVQQPNADLDRIRRDLAPAWGRRLAALLEENPGAASDLKQVIERIRTELSASGQQAWFQQHNTASSGGTVIAHQGPGAQHIRYYDESGHDRSEQADEDT